MKTKLKKLTQLIYGSLRYDPYVFFRYCWSFLTSSPATEVREITSAQFLDSLKEKKSFIRIGDGEVLLITGRDIYFQPTSPNLSEKIKTIIADYSNSAPYILGVPTNKLPLTEDQLGGPEKIRIWRLYRTLFPLRFPTQADFAPLTQFYTQGYFENTITPLFTARHVICVSNEKVLDSTLRTYMKGTFADATFITTPDHDAYNEYNRIYSEVMAAAEQKSTQTPLVLGAAGPATKVLAYELAKQGIQCLDLGHGMELIAHNKDRSHKI